jgi:peptide deformylase
MLMALLQVHEFPDPILQQHAMPVTVFDDKLRQLAADMLETMYEEKRDWLSSQPGSSPQTNCRG